MTKSEFNKRAKALQLTSKGLPAARDVLVGGSSLYAACRAHDVSYAVLWRLVDRIGNAELCPKCGQEVKDHA